MRVTAGIDGLRAAMESETRRIEQAMWDAMWQATQGLKEDLRDQVRRAGLGERLAKTWRGEVYPQSGRTMNPAGYVWSHAPAIIHSFTTGASISARNSSYLAIPISPVIKRGGKPMSPEETEHYFNQDMILRKGKRGTLLGFMDLLAARSKRRPGFRPATPGRLAQGRTRKLTLMFVFVRRVKMPKLLDLNAAAAKWGAKVPGFFAARIG